MRFTKVTPEMFFGNDTNYEVRRSQVQPVTVIPALPEIPLSTPVMVKIQCGSTLISATFTTVADIYQRAWERLARLQGPSWCRNKFRVEVLFRERLLVNRDVFLRAHGIRDGDLIIVRASGCLFGGNKGMVVGNEYYPDVVDTWCARKKARSRKLNTFTHMSHEYALNDRSRKVVKRRERSLEEREFDLYDNVRMEVQASSDYMTMAQSFIKSLDTRFDTDFLKLMEDILIFMILLGRSRVKGDIMLALLVFVKLRTARALVTEAVDNLTFFVDAIFPDEDIRSAVVQAGPKDLADRVTDFRDVLAKWSELKDTTLGKKYMKLMRYLAAYGVFSCVGIKPSVDNLKKAGDLEFHLNNCDFLFCVVDTTSFFLQCSLLYLKTGEWSVFLHGPKTYSAWYDKCLEIKRQAYNLGNLESQGTSYFKFVGDLKVCIQEGQAIVKFAAKDLKSEMKAARFMLHEILMIEANVLTKKAAQQERRAPFAVLVHGESSVAKSMFQKMLFFYYGKLMNLPTESEYKFVRNPADPFWSGFSSQAWCIQLDDVGFLNPAKASEDVSLTELIALINNVPLVPNQADLADKGKTPVRAKFVIASSNTKHLNAAHYFSCPLAVQRRLPWVLTVTPRPEFERADAAGMIDPERMMAIDGDWPNFWRIQVDKVVPAGKAGDRAMAKFEPVISFDDTNAFLDWFGPACKAFDAIQAKAMLDDVKMSELKLCPLCNRTTKRCECGMNPDGEAPVVQAAGEMLLPPGVVYGRDFMTQVEEGDITENKKFIFADGRYMCHTRFFKRGEFVREHYAPITIVKTITAPPKPNVGTVDYADILREVVDRQRKQESSKTGRCVTWGISAVLRLYVASPMFRRYADWLVSWSVTRTVLRRVVRSYIPPSTLARSFFSFVGVLCERTFVNKKWRKTLIGLGAVASAWIAYKRLCKWNVQGTTMSVPDDHFVKTEKENVWKRDDYETTTFDLDPMSLNYASLPVDQVVARIRRNTARIFVRSTGVMIPGNAFCVGGHLWVTNNHILPDIESDLEIEFCIDPMGQGTSRNTKFKLEQSAIYRESGSDLAYFEILAVDARPDLTKLISRGSLEGDFEAKYIGLNRDCSPKDVNVCGVRKLMAHCEAHDRMYTYWRGMVDEDTVNGDCGTPLVGIRPSVVILGLHQLGGSNKMAFAVKLTQSSLQRALSHFARPIVQAGVPMLSSKEVKKELGPLGHRSPLRWLTSGSIVSYGTFIGYQVRSRSKVASTLCGEHIKKIREWKIPFGAPDLKDWRPWRLAVKDIVEQSNVLKSSVLKQAVDGYVRDVCAGLKPGDLDNLKILSMNASINGIAGVQYIDKLNFNSSMGEPFCKSKKHFTVKAPNEEQPDAKLFNDEIMERINEIIRRYKAGVRACPVFSGQLKDEARAEIKVLLGKIRVFTGAPVDWSVVVRMYLLSFVKVVQENRTLFEAAPGCVTQSLEWEQFRDYLVAHGADQIIAGDYGKFDKKMTAQMILAAFDAIIGILKFAGWSMEELLVVYGIAEDTAYPLINFNGDLIMVYGSNPSGHPLTVIINSIANALYMRYCYIELNPARECWSFKLYVNLLTYGDDNVMGVSKLVLWFNHTAIVKVLASIGVEYTMADKESESVPFINISNVSFLKRAWRWDADVGAWLCPLEIESIHKMLCINIPSKTISPQAQMMSVMNSAVREWFYYGRETFEAERAFLLEVVEVYRLEKQLAMTPFPTWDQLKETFWRASEGMTTVRLGEYNSHPALPKPSVVNV